MPINIVRASIIKVKGDAIVNSADSSLLGGHGVDEAVHQAAGPELLEECRTLGGCKPGRARITGAYGLPCKYIIHTVVPTWKDGWYNGWRQRRQLASCYRACLKLALECGCKSIAFPLLGTGSRGYPKDKALQIAMKTINAFLSSHDGCEMQVSLVVYHRADYQIDPKLARKVADHLGKEGLVFGSQAAVRPPENENTCAFLSEGERLSPPAKDAPAMPSQQPEISPPAMQNLFVPPRQPGIAGGTVQPPSVRTRKPKSPPARRKPSTRAQKEAAKRDVPSPLKDMLEHLDEGFSRTLLRLIDEKGIKRDSQCYNKANVDRRLFSRIRSNPDYRPSKPTALAFAVALELTLDETNSLLQRAGFALSPARPFDAIVSYFISQGFYDVFAINEVLYSYDQPQLGGSSE